MCATLILAAKAVIYQRDFYANNGVYDSRTFWPEDDQCFDYWAADILAQAMLTDGIITVESPT